MSNSVPYIDSLLDDWLRDVCLSNCPLLRSARYRYYFTSCLSFLSKSVFRPGTRVDVINDPNSNNVCYHVQKYDSANRRYFLTYKSRSFGGLFGFWISSRFVHKHERKNTHG